VLELVLHTWIRTTSRVRQISIFFSLCGHLLRLHSDRPCNDTGTGHIRRKPCPTVILSTTNPTRTRLGYNLGSCGDIPTTNGLSHGTGTVLLCSGSVHKQAVTSSIIWPPQHPHFKHSTNCFKHKCYLGQSTTMRDFRLSQRRNSVLRSSGLLRCVAVWLVYNHPATLRNTPEERTTKSTLTCCIFK
jgi:hypothetical protein